MVRISRRGFSLPEALVGTAIAALLTLAAVEFARQESRLVGLSKQSVESGRRGRTALERLVRDVERAGQGLGYGLNGSYPGLHVGGGSFFGLTIPQEFSGRHEDGAPDHTANAPVPQSVLGITFVAGSSAAVVHYTPAGRIQICLDPGLPLLPGDAALLESEDALVLRPVAVAEVMAGPAGCSGDQCRGGCQTIRLACLQGGLSKLASPGAPGINFRGGVIYDKLESHLWFAGVGSDSEGSQSAQALRRVGVRAGEPPCGGTLQPDCGELVVEGLESFQVRVWRWESEDGRWSVVSPSENPQLVFPSRPRLRVDLELVLRGSKQDPALQPTVVSAISGAQLPGVPDDMARRAYRTSVELRASEGAGHWRQVW